MLKKLKYLLQTQAKPFNKEVITFFCFGTGTNISLKISIDDVQKIGDVIFLVEILTGKV